MPARKRASGGGIDARRALEEFHDHLAPKLDVYEQAVYLYLLRHSRLVGKPSVTVELKSLPQRLAGVPGPGGRRIGSRTCATKLETLAHKGCLEIVEKQRDRAAVHLRLPSEIPGLVAGAPAATEPDLETIDFTASPRLRRLILERDRRRCFYCLKKLTESSFVVDRVAPGPGLDTSYRNVVATCRRCNNRKGESGAEDLLRVLYRENYVGADELAARLAALGDLRAGRLRPKLST